MGLRQCIGFVRDCLDLHCGHTILVKRSCGGTALIIDAYSRLRNHCFRRILQRENLQNHLESVSKRDCNCVVVMCYHWLADVMESTIPCIREAGKTRFRERLLTRATNSRRSSTSSRASRSMSKMPDTMVPLVFEATDRQFSLKNETHEFFKAPETPRKSAFDNTPNTLLASMTPEDTMHKFDARITRHFHIHDDFFAISKLSSTIA